MKQSLHLNLSQQLTLTPQLKQSLKLLQLSSLDLEHEIQSQLESNPLLERVDQVRPDADVPDTHTQAKDNNIPQPVSEAADPGMEMDRTDGLAPEQDLALNYAMSVVSRQEQPATLTTTASHNAATENEFTNFVSQQETLTEHLLWQLQMTKLTERDREIGETLIHNLDGDGYFKIPLSDVCNQMSWLEIDEDEVQAVLSMLRSFEPTGVGALNLQDRLRMLLAKHKSDESFQLANSLIEDHLQELANHNYAKLLKDLGTNRDELGAAIALITKLNPRIGARFEEDEQNHITPDLILHRREGDWQVEINPDNQAKLRVNEEYATILGRSRALNEDDGSYIQNKLAEAKMFIKGLMSRYDTLLLVGQVILEKQQAFFEQGEEAMQPMVLQDIAQALDMHESTISRATAGKYLLCPRGVYELKFFFSSALSNTEGNSSSSTAIRSMIKKLVDKECKTKPLSDSKIAKELEQQGHIVARRTVAKYRESLQIAPSSQRKRLS